MPNAGPARGKFAATPAPVPITEWYCPNCGLEDRTQLLRAHTQFHHCRRFGGLSMPMVQRGVRAGIRTVEREDYIGAERVRLHEGRPVMSIITERDDGQDAIVFAPTATN